MVLLFHNDGAMAQVGKRQPDRDRGGSLASIRAAKLQMSLRGNRQAAIKANNRRLNPGGKRICRL